MSTHRFILEPYKGVSTRHTCPNCHRKRCFSKYIDTEKRIQFPDYVGRCDHEQKCGYHFTPRDYFERNPSEKKKLSEDNFRSYTPIKEVEPKATSYIDLDIVNQSLQRYPDNKLFQFLSAQFGEAETLKLMAKYKVGTSKHWDGATVFWQIDYQNRVRTGKIMLYNPTTGKRIKEPYNHVTWVHSVHLYWKNEAPIYDADKMNTICANFLIDTVVTHTAPSHCELFSKSNLNQWAENDSSLLKDVQSERKTMDMILHHLKTDNHPVNHWYYGHFHQNWHSAIDGILYQMLDIMEFSQVY